ncbi:MAG TPA: SDR family oxidoreductase [Pseudobdellovibrionaceae bacterium]|nr:SDR family oxidoreductase [Pseudobdellovibrionaceae bacterium]
MSRPRILVTGGTGFLGRHVVPLLRKNHDVDVFSRSGSAEIKGDLTQWNAGLESVDSLKGRYQAFLHLAGLYDLCASQTDCYLHNVVATNQALRLCQRLEIPVFLNTSSVAAAINVDSEKVSPFQVNLNSSFPDAYSESKAVAEKLIQTWDGGPRLRINLRPGVLVGDARQGEIERIDGPYYAPIAVGKLKKVLESFPGPLILPGDEGRRLPLVPVDACAAAIVKIVGASLASEKSGYQSYHLVPEEGLPIRDFYASVLRHLLIHHGGIKLVHQVPHVFMKKISKWALGFPEAQLTYLLSFPRYETSTNKEILGADWCPEFSSYERTFWSGYEKFVSNR